MVTALSVEDELLLIAKFTVDVDNCSPCLPVTEDISLMIALGTLIWMKGDDKLLLLLLADVCISTTCSPPMLDACMSLTLRFDDEDLISIANRSCFLICTSTDFN